MRLGSFVCLCCLLAACQSTSEMIIPPPKVVPVVNADDYPKPVIRITPAYPGNASKNGKEGWVLLAYDVDASGTPIDIKLQDSSPKGVFEESAINALKKWKYLPPKKNGKYQPQKGLKTVIEYKLQ